MVLRSIVALAILLGCSVGPAAAMSPESPGVDEEVTETVSFGADRPGFGDATSVVPPLRLALEVGIIQATSDDALGLELPLGLLRLGLTSWLEARVQLPGLSVPIGGDDVPRGTDGGLGLKVAYDLHERVALSVVTTFGVPVVELLDGYSAFLWSGSINLGFAVSETVGLGLTGAGSVDQTLGLGDDVLSWELGGSMGIMGTFDATGLYIEGIVTADQAGAWRIAIGLGATHMLSPTLQLDLYFDYDLPEFGSTTRVGMGLATLF